MRWASSVLPLIPIAVSSDRLLRPEGEGYHRGQAYGVHSVIAGRAIFKSSHQAFPGRPVRTGSSRLMGMWRSGTLLPWRWIIQAFN